MKGEMGLKDVRSYDRLLDQFDSQFLKLFELYSAGAPQKDLEEVLLALENSVHELKEKLPKLRATLPAE